MDITRSVQGPVAVLAVKGPLIEEELEILDKEIEQTVRAGLHKVILDIKEMPFIDSAGLEKLQTLVSNLGKQGQNLCVATPNEICRDIFMATRLDNFMLIFEDREQALRKLI
ncbi:STAS domain-containing protein [bacterium]|nr:STAS domain-containing protein [bacterium]